MWITAFKYHFLLIKKWVLMVAALFLYKNVCFNWVKQILLSIKKTTYRKSFRRWASSVDVPAFFTKHVAKILHFTETVARSLRPTTSWKKTLCHMCLIMNFVKFLRILFFIECLWWLLLTSFSCIFNCYNWKTVQVWVNIITITTFHYNVLLMRISQTYSVPVLHFQERRCLAWLLHGLFS